jgi:hypothetical protein
MSKQAALDFIAASRTRPALRDAIRSRHAERGLDALVEIGREAGFAFSAADLRAAFRHDWVMRYVRGGSGERPLSES